MRPDLGELVHSHEHGWRIVWYDETVASNGESMKALEDVAAAVKDGGLAKVVFMPWTAEDGARFPDGAHVAMTQWSAADGGEEHRQLCASATDEAVTAFVERNPASDCPEPNAP